jgi:hypothetical protein
MRECSGSHASRRRDPGSSLNFIVPADLMQGIVRFTARIWVLGDTTRTPIDTWEETVDASLLQARLLLGLAGCQAFVVAPLLTGTRRRTGRADPRRTRALTGTCRRTSAVSC